MPGVGFGSGRSGVWRCWCGVPKKGARRMRMKWHRDCLQLDIRPAFPLLFEHVREGAWSGWWVRPGRGWAGQGEVLTWHVAACVIPIAGCSDFTLRPQQA